MTDRAKGAFSSAADLAKQLLTIGTGVIGVTVTFSKDLIGRMPEGDRWRLELAWGLLTLSLIGGVWALMALTGALGSAKVTDAALAVYAGSIRIAFVVQIVLFLAGLGFLIAAGMSIVDVAPHPEAP